MALEGLMEETSIKQIIDKDGAMLTSEATEQVEQPELPYSGELLGRPDRGGRHWAGRCGLMMAMGSLGKHRALPAFTLSCQCLRLASDYDPAGMRAWGVQADQQAGQGKAGEGKRETRSGSYPSL